MVTFWDFIWILSFLFYFSYNGAITKCVTAIIVLKRKCKEYQQDGDEEQTARSQSSVVMGPPQVPALVGPGTRDSSRSSSNETEQEVGVMSVFCHQLKSHSNTLNAFNVLVSPTVREIYAGENWFTGEKNILHAWCLQKKYCVYHVPYLALLSDISFLPLLKMTKVNSFFLYSKSFHSVDLVKPESVVYSPNSWSNQFKIGFLLLNLSF